MFSKQIKILVKEKFFRFLSKTFCYNILCQKFSEKIEISDKSFRHKIAIFEEKNCKLKFFLSTRSFVQI